MDTKILVIVEKLKSLINQAVIKDDKYQFIDPAYELIDELEECEHPFDAIKPIFELIETSPNIDYGGPGPLGSFMEEYYHEGYEEELVASLNRKPTNYTIFLMFRVIADKSNPDLDRYKKILKTVKYTSDIDSYWIDEIEKL